MQFIGEVALTAALAETPHEPPPSSTSRSSTAGWSQLKSIPLSVNPPAGVLKPQRKIL